nr:fumarate hydratase [Candidatus Sigynarchaeota archaeon]
MVDLKDAIADAMVQVIKLAATRVRKDVRNLIAAAAKEETNQLARKQLEYLLQNFELAAKECLPYCQDTGTIHVFGTIGEQFPIRAGIYAAIEAGIVNATKTIPLRPNSVDPISETMKYKDNTGPGLPDVSLRVVPGDMLELDVLLKGAGSENMSKLVMLEPIGAKERIPGIVREYMINAGGKPCPPVIIGIGIGGSASTCMGIAKKSLLREAGAPHPDPATHTLEIAIKDAVNSTGIGTMGLGGAITCLAVHVDTCARHPASFPVGIVVQCYAHRHARVRVEKDGYKTIPEEFYP